MCRIDRKTCFKNTLNTKCVNVIIDSTGPSIILRSIYTLYGHSNVPCTCIFK